MPGRVRRWAGSDSHGPAEAGHYRCGPRLPDRVGVGPNLPLTVRLKPDTTVAVRDCLVRSGIGRDRTGAKITGSVRLQPDLGCRGDLLLDPPSNDVEHLTPVVLEHHEV